jgi:hypothetical protein
MLVRWSVDPLVCWLVRPSVGPHDEILRNCYVENWLRRYSMASPPDLRNKNKFLPGVFVIDVAIASRRGEGRGKLVTSKTGHVEIASRLVTVARSCLLSTH